MPTFVLSGAHVAAKFGIFDTAALMNYAQNKLLGAHETIPPSLIKDNGTFYDFPYLSSIAVTIEGGVRQIQALGLENVAALEEEGIGFNDVTIECFAQPIPAMAKIFSLFKRTAESYNHFPFAAIRACARGTYYTEESGGGFGNAWLDFWACVPRTLTFSQPTGSPATIRLSLGAGYIYHTVPVTTPFTISYNIEKGILNIFEGVMKLYADTSGNNPIMADFPLFVSALTFDIRNTVNPIHTFLADNFSDEKFMRAVRMWRALMDAIQVVEGNFTVLMMRKDATMLNVNELQRVGRIDILYYPFAGYSAPDTGVPSNYEMRITLYNVKFTRSSTNITPDGALQWTTNFVASNPTAEAWEFEVAQ